MKLNYTFPFDDAYLPTPKCKKLRHREGNGAVEIEIKELTGRQAPVAMVINRYDGLKQEIRAFKGKLFKRIIETLEYQNPKGYRTEFNEDFIHCHIGHNYWNYTEKDAVKDIKKKSKELIIVNGELYELTNTPYYRVLVFGIGESCSLNVETYNEYNGVGTIYGVNEFDKAKEKLHELSVVCEKPFENINEWVDILLPELAKDFIPEKVN